MKKTVLCLFVLFMIQSGVHANDATMRRVMDSWRGENIDTVMKYWGYPSNEKNMAGHKLLYWYQNQNAQLMQTPEYVGVASVYYCTRILEVDKQNIVSSWQYKGNNCPNFYFTSKKWVNPNNDPWQKEKMQKKLLKQQKKIKTEKRNEV